MPSVLAHVGVYAPRRNGGGETTMHALLVELVRHGWDATVLNIAHRGATYDVNGVRVVRGGPDKMLRGHYEDADVVLTHLHASTSAMAWARRVDRPLVHVVHNHRQLERWHVARGRCDLAVMNSAWVADAINWRGESVVVHPPTRTGDYATENASRFDDGAVTLVNCNPAKGGAMFWRLAARRPHRRFLGVTGSYGAQLRPPAELCNTELAPHATDVRPYYARTGVLAVPSAYESWGKAAVEAMASGIPVVAAPTPGLRESLADAAIFADPCDDDAWDRALASLESWDEWRCRSHASSARSVELTAVVDRQLADWRDRMTVLAGG